jgi:gliding motility-associated-like protein
MKRFCFVLFVCMLLFVRPSAAQTNFTITKSSTCAGTNILFSSNVFEMAPFPDTIRWNFGDAASGVLNTANGLQEASHIYNTSGTYVITLHIVDPGSGTIDITDTITTVTPVVHNFGPDVFLCGDTGTYVLNAPLLLNVTYEWNDDSLTKTPTLAVRETGTYTVKINGCPVTDTIGVFFTREPNLDLGRNHVLCAGEQLTLNAVSENATYEWLLNGAVLPNAQPQLPVVAPGGQYIARIEVAGCGDYADTVTITFNNTPAPAFSLGVDTLLCPKEIFTLTANVAGATAWSWSSKGLSVDDYVNYDIDRDATITIRDAGRYWAFVTVAGQCEVVDTMLVRYRGDKQLNFNDTALCLGTTLVLDADFGSGTYKWESIPPQRDDQNNTNQSTYYVYKPGFYTVTASVGHCLFQDSLHVVFNDTLQLKLPGDTTLCRGETFIITPQANTLNYTWQDGTNTAAYTATKSGLYRITAENGCGRDTADMNILFESCPCALLLPNAFTPNGDGINDNFRPLHACDMADYTMTIFNRYGEKIYFSQNPLQGWNGKQQTTLLNQGAYVWTVQYTKISTKQQIQKQGSVLLLR